MCHAKACNPTEADEASVQDSGGKRGAFRQTHVPQATQATARGYSAVCAYPVTLKRPPFFPTASAAPS